MKPNLCASISLVLALACAVRADDAAAARAIIDKAIEAAGGEAELSKYKAFSAKIKGDLFLQGMKLPFSGEVQTQGADQERIAIELDFDGQKFPVVHVLNRDRGWVKVAGETSEMDMDELAETSEQAHVGWVGTLWPLKNKTFTLATVGEIEVEGKPARGVRVSHVGRRDVSLFFDKDSHLLVKIETRVKNEDTGQEQTEETFLSGYSGTNVQTALKLLIKRDGKTYLDFELSDVRLEEQLDDAVFAMP